MVSTPRTEVIITDLLKIKKRTDKLQPSVPTFCLSMLYKPKPVLVYLKSVTDTLPFLESIPTEEVESGCFISTSYLFPNDTTVGDA